MFDNLYHVGPCYVAAYLLTTPQGVIMFDTTQEPFVDKLIDNIKKVGVNPRDIKYIIINHGHIDHFGGSACVKARSAALRLLSASIRKVAEVTTSSPALTPSSTST